MEFLHNKGFLHRDIKPDNFMMGRDSTKSVVHLIDFGLAKRFRHPTTCRHISYRDGKKLTGTARYASISTHLGVEQSRRDDVEGLGYTLIYLAKGGLPWQGVKGANKLEKYSRIGEKKSATSIRALCEGLPPEFAAFMHYCLTLGFEDRPDYTSMRRCFRNRLAKLIPDDKFRFDWELLLPDSDSTQQGKNRGSSNGTGKAELDDNSPVRIAEGEKNQSCTNVARLSLGQDTAKGESCLNVRKIMQMEEAKDAPSPVARMIVANTPTAVNTGPRVVSFSGDTGKRIDRERG